MKNSIGLTITALASMMLSCDGPKADLPLLGPYEVHDTIIDGVLKTDTLFTGIRPFEFTDQAGEVVDHSTIEGKIYVTDFFFTSCPTICPTMKQQMLRIYGEFQDESGFVLISHSIDPKRDSVGRLRDYAEKLGISADRWHLVTGERDSIFSMARHYMVVAQEDRLAPGGYAHSGSFLLVDRNKQIRGIYDGTDEEEVDQLIKDIAYLLDEGS